MCNCFKCRHHRIRGDGALICKKDGEYLDPETQGKCIEECKCIGFEEDLEYSNCLECDLLFEIQGRKGMYLCEGNTRRFGNGLVDVSEPGVRALMRERGCGCFSQKEKASQSSREEAKEPR